MNSVYNAGVTVESLPQRGRRLRKPQHNFMVRHKPFALQPFMIAPVLPGDTMKNLLMQATVVTDPIKNSTLGWWNEFYFFYVKLRDLPERTAIEQMLIANAAAPAAGTADLACNYAGEGVNWVRKCLDRVRDCYFRSEEEVEQGMGMFAHDGAATNPLPLAKLVTVPGWMENLKIGNDTPISDGTPLPGAAFPPLPDHLTGFADAYTQWQEMQHLEMAPANFTDYLKTFGIRPPAALREEKHQPELLRYVRNFKKPSNTVSGDGAINSQVVWSDVAERGDKDRFFAEPGFIFGVTTTRAKMYSAKQTASMSSFLNDAYSWLPALLQPDPFTSLKKFAFGGVGPLANQDEDYWVDLADLFVGGDQFVNMDPTGLPGFVNTPADLDFPTKIHKDYPFVGDIDALFANPAKNLVYVEGRADLTILSSVQDTTP